MIRASSSAEKEVCVGRFLSLKYDYAFKELFQNEEVCRYFLSDVLKIPPEEIRSVRLVNTFLRRRLQKQKQGILDVALEMNDDSRIDIELQIRTMAFWDRRSLFYLSKLFTDGLRTGQQYERLKRCICISVLGFELDHGEEYHKVYRFRDRSGREFSDMLEIHVIELGKPLKGTDKVDDWIRLFNAKTEEELDMLKAQTKNRGVIEAIKEVRIMNLGRMLRMMYEARQKAARDRYAEDYYVREQGREQGIEQGEERASRLYIRLMEDGRYEDLKKAAENKAYRERMYKEYKI